jgi:hypothetical protein
MKVGVNAAPARRGGTLALFVAIVLGAAGRLPAFEFEYWPKVIVRVALNDRWQLGLEEWGTLVDNGSRLKDNQTDLWLNYFGPVDWLYFGVGYKRTYTKDGDDWTTEDRPMLDAAVRTKVHGFGVTDRSRIEYRLIQDEDPSWRYRNRLTITAPVTFTPLKILPYMAEEIFIVSDGQGFNQQRLYGGVLIPLHENVCLDLFYFWKLDKCDDDWHDTNVLGSWVCFQF